MLWQPTRGILQPNQHWRRPSGGAFDPLSLGPALFLLAQPAYLFQGENGATPVTADGQAVASVENRGTDGGFWNQPSSASRATYNTDGAFHWLTIDGADDWFDIALSSIRTLCMAVRVASGSGSLETWVSAGDDSNNQRLSNDTPTTSWRNEIEEFPINSGDFGFEGATFVNGAAGYTFTSNTDHVLRVEAAAAKTIGVLFRSDASNGRYATGRMYALFGFPDVLTPSEAGAVDAYLAGLAPDLV